LKLFLDTSVLLAACGSANGSSRALLRYARNQDWQLLVSPWVLGEVARNLNKLNSAASAEWLRCRERLVIVKDVVSIDRPLVFPISKDRPVLLTALAYAQVLLTLDRADFHGALGGHFYGLPILVPSAFIKRMRAVGHLQKD
jgi:predicted nucleic acid-binding protein